MLRWMRDLFGTGSIALSLAGAALAADGVLEINGACAATGCFPGDTPGFPVQITQPGSYRLTSNLTVPAATNGIEINTNGVDLDLGGFEIAGPVVCNPTCPAMTTGTGIAGGFGLGNQSFVRNGKVRGFGLNGISLGQLGRVEDVRVSEVARYGLLLGDGSLAAGNQIHRTGQNGIFFNVTSAGPALYERNTVNATGAQSVLGGRASGPNACADQLCGTGGKKFFYLTTTTHLGAAALGACATGFHMASLYEIYDPSNVEYDTARGFNQPDSGQGPPAVFGWVRTGGELQDIDLVTYNCRAWTTSSSVGSFGSFVAPQGTWSQSSPPGEIPPWFGESQLFACNSPHRVWCVQD